eukprot:gnl/MRDRNA2_/MRDRNA2_49631_c0_seq1.p1 gnl/MRDRNA2_/MRDRNA2_49631_c0~~gnl/MRDRNA2_/MRDRNA2_49631_c0_seq1.p1  ORF type:complete len:267 (-),score=46.89 gnl/MRDRNA2_/MRDRNA2_49631_c0_seq1:97-897(-)
MGSTVAKKTSQPLATSSATEDAGAFEYVDASLDEDTLKSFGGFSEQFSESIEREKDEKRIKQLQAKLSGVVDGTFTAHLKGFASGLQLQNSQRESILDLLLQRLSKHKVSTLVWDGDDFGVESFTSFLPDLQAAMPTLKLVAFLRQSERNCRYKNDAGFHGAWVTGDNLGPRLKNLIVVMVDDEVSAFNRYEHLGVLALRATGSKLVFAIGGGNVVLREYQSMQMYQSSNSPRVQYCVFDVPRMLNGQRLGSSLNDELDGVEVVQF